ncbi:DUF5058 family protein [Christensenellaceae bacterium OttesenSCG-928-L17]|nr:DUF5058 family protein [Christensenellaceae bacterium OttesenSCG-928-L17]
MREFNVNSLFLYALTAIVIVFVLAQSAFFLRKAWRRAKEIGMDVAVLKRTVFSSAIFSIAPAVSILLGVITLSKFLGLPLPWLRLSVVGALTYELPAATAAAAATNTSLAATVTDPRAYATIAWVMTLGIIPGLIIIPLALKKIQSGVVRIGAKDKKWGDTFMSALFLGMISAFLGLVFADVRSGLVGWIPFFVMLCSAALMGVFGTLVRKGNVQWLENYALPFSMLGAMALAIPITNWIV